MLFAGARAGTEPMAGSRPLLQARIHLAHRPNREALSIDIAVA
jgi:hypothetical protein